MNVAGILRRHYRIAIASAAVVAVGSTGGLLLSGTDDRSGGTVRTSARQSTDPAAAAAAVTVPEAAAPGTGPTADPDLASAAPVESVPARETVPARASEPARQSSPPAEKVLDYGYQVQSTYYYCGPAATRIALTSTGVSASQDELAARLNTDAGGTDSAEDTTRVLNDLTRPGAYRTRSMQVVTPALMDQLQGDVVRAVTDGRAVVANIVGSASDTSGRWHSYPGGHYVTVVGYRDEGRTVKIADPANANVSSYWITTIDLANWMASRGYSA